MPCGGQRAPSSTRLVDWSGIRRLFDKLVLVSRLEPDDGNGVVKMLGVRLGNNHLFPVPTCSLKEQPLQESG